MKFHRLHGKIALVLMLAAGTVSGCTLPDEIIKPVEEVVSTVKQNIELKQQMNALALPKDVESISKGRYAYESLSKENKVIYDQMLDAIMLHEEETALSATENSYLEDIFNCIKADYGGLFWVDSFRYTQYQRNGQTEMMSFSPNYTMSLEKRQKTQKKINKRVKKFLKGIRRGDSDYEKVKYVYRKLIEQTDYNLEAPDNQNIISVFIHQKTVCQGYACAVQYLLEQLGIQSVIVSGMALGEPHAWNLICLDGEYYYMDATWGNNGYRNKEGKETSFIDYNYMAMTTAEMQLGHMPDSEQNLPECTSVVNNYYRKEGNYIETWEPDVIGSKLVEAWEAQQVITLRFSDNALRKRAFRYFIKEGHIADYCYGLSQINYIEDPSWKEISFCFNQS